MGKKISRRHGIGDLKKGLVSFKEGEGRLIFARERKKETGPIRREEKRRKGKGSLFTGKGRTLCQHSRSKWKGGGKDLVMRGRRGKKEEKGSPSVVRLAQKVRKKGGRGLRHPRPAHRWQGDSDDIPGRKTPALQL